MLNEACGVPLPVPERSDLATKPEPHAGENVAQLYADREGEDHRRRGDGTRHRSVARRRRLCVAGGGMMNSEFVPFQSQ